MTVDRMIMTENLFRISKPGFDVNTATPQQLAFSENMFGLVPAVKGTFSSTATVALPEAGFVPLILFLFDEVGTYRAVINSAKTTVTITANGATAPSGRYVIFKNRQY